LKGPFITPLKPENQFLVVHDPVLYGFRHQSADKVQSVIGSGGSGETDGISESDANSQKSPDNDRKIWP
jgi:hypothetical protein